MGISDPFSGKRYLITGASAGFGDAYARALHVRGADVFLVARREDRLAELSDLLNATRANSAQSRAIDLGDAAALQTLVHTVSSERFDGLINNAGFGSYGRFEELDIEREIQMVRVNVEAPMRLTHAVLPQMLERGEGVIVNLASVAGFQPLPYMATYSATKAMNLFYSRAHREELKKRGVLVLAVCPGPVKTEFAATAGMEGDSVAPVGDSVADVVSATLAGIVHRKGVVVPGMIGKLSSFFSRLTPRWLNMFLVERALRRSL